MSEEFDMSEEIEQGQVLLKSYNDFESFLKWENPYKWVAVQNLLDVLKEKNKFLSKYGFINLVSKKKLRMSSPSHVGFIAAIDGRTSRWYNSQTLRVQVLGEREKYWNYVKKCLFGDLEGSDRGLMDINVLTDKDLKEITSLIFSDLTVEDKESFFSHVSGVGVMDKNDIFCPQNKEKLANDLIQYKRLFNKQNANDNEEQLTDDFVKCEQSPNGQNMSNSKKRLIAGIILLSLGIVLFAVTLIIGLKSIFAIVLFLSSLIMVTIGVTCLFWEKTCECLSSCCSQIKSSIVDEVSVVKNSSRDQQISMNKKYEEVSK